MNSKKVEEIIDIFHENGLIDGPKHRNYREKALRKYNGFSRPRRRL